MKTKPYNRHETFLAALTDSSITVPGPLTREERYLAKIAGESVTIPDAPYNRYETYLAKLAGESVTVPTPASRLEVFLYKACGYDVQEPTPANREEIFWKRCVGSEATGGSVTINDAAAEAPRSMVVSISAVQEGTGTPSKTNIRQITGFQNAELQVENEDSSIKNTYQIDLTGAGTVYGGTLDATNAILTVTHHYEVLSPSIYSTAQEDGFDSWWTRPNDRRYNYASLVANSQQDRISNEIKKPASDSALPSLICNMAPPQTANRTYARNAGMSVNYTSGQLHLSFGGIAESGAELRTFLLDNRATVCYELSRDMYEQYQLPPIGIRLLQGYNKITCNCGTITIKYTPDL